MKRTYLIILFFTIGFTFSAFAQINKRPPYNYKYWSSQRTYEFNAKYIDIDGKVLTDENLEIHPTEKIWDIDSKQTLLNFKLNYKKEDSILYANKPLNNKKRGWENNYQEGAIEDSSKIWMHPVRNNQYLLTEIAPFPEVRFPLSIGKNWNGTLWIYEAFGTFQGTVTYNYLIEGVEVRKYLFGTFKCWKILARGMHDKLGESSVIFYFNTELGFTEMNYIFYNGQKIIFTLTNFEL
ncbi:MAG: hypothetical protein PSX81_07710 [bacterium]|nr:hypothetical protein [bacterium]